MGAEHRDSLDQVRERIDALDRAIVRLLAERGQYVAQAAVFKRDPESVRAPQRASEVIASAVKIGVQEGAEGVVIERIYREIVAAFTDAEMRRHFSK